MIGVRRFSIRKDMNPFLPPNFPNDISSAPSGWPLFTYISRLARVLVPVLC